MASPVETQPEINGNEPPNIIRSQDSFWNSHPEAYLPAYLYIASTINASSEYMIVIENSRLPEEDLHQIDLRRKQIFPPEDNQNPDISVGFDRNRWEVLIHNSQENSEPPATIFLEDTRHGQALQITSESGEVVIRANLNLMNNEVIEVRLRSGSLIRDMDPNTRKKFEEIIESKVGINLTGYKPLVESHEPYRIAHFNDIVAKALKGGLVNMFVFSEATNKEDKMRMMSILNLLEKKNFNLRLFMILKTLGAGIGAMKGLSAVSEELKDLPDEILEYIKKWDVRMEGNGETIIMNNNSGDEPVEMILTKDENGYHIKVVRGELDAEDSNNLVTLSFDGEGKFDLE
ncbi:MAG TPA: hypothetical protein VGA67_04185, partial [Candidatus Dojkabacteria bacterium]